MAADLRLAARRLLATPLFTIFAVLSLAIGVAVTTAVYSVVDSIFLRDTGARDPDRLVFVASPYDGRMLTGSISLPDFEDVRAAQTSFSSMSASGRFSPAVASSSTTELLSAEAVDGAYFSTLGVSPAIGRTIQPADDAGAARVVVLSHALWRKRFAANPAVVGQTIRVARARAPQKDGIDDRVDGGGDGDAKRQREHREEGEKGSGEQPPRSESQVGNHQGILLCP